MGKFRRKAFMYVISKWKVNKYPNFGHMLHDLFSIFIIWCINEKKISVEECNASKPGNGFLIEFGFDFVPRKF